MASKKKSRKTDAPQKSRKTEAPRNALAGIAGKFLPKASPAERLAAAARTGNPDLLAAVRLEQGR